MTAPLLRTANVFDDCEAFVDIAGARNTPIESYLVQHLLVVLCAEVQQEVYEIVDRRAKVGADSQLQHFVKAATKRVLRSIGKKELTGFVGHFGSLEKETFKELCDERIVTKYSNAVTNRHDIAHKSGVQLTLGEVKEAIESAREIILAVETAIALKDA